MPYPAYAADRWKIFREVNNITETVKGLRRTFISIAKNRMPAEMLKNIVGHSESMDTFGVYGRIVNGELQESAQILNAVFSHLLNK